MEKWHRQGARPKVFLKKQSKHKAASVSDLTLPKDWPSSNRVHFNDDVDYVSSEPLQRNHRAVSHPDLSVSGFSANELPVTSKSTSLTLPNPARKTHKSSETFSWEDMSQDVSSGPELAHEIGYYSRLYEDINSGCKAKKSKRPWRRNRAKFNPSDENDILFSNLVKARSVSDISQSGSTKHATSESTNDDGSWPKEPRFSGQSSSAADLQSSASQQSSLAREENPYEDVSVLQERLPPNRPPKPPRLHQRGLQKFLLVQAINDCVQ